MTKTIKTEVKVNPKLISTAKRLFNDYGAMTAVQAIAVKHKELRRRDMLAIAKAVGINLNTASNEFTRARNGTVELVNLGDLGAV